MSEPTLYLKLQNELMRLLDLGELIAKHTGRRPAFIGHPWTALKLVFLKLYVPLYTKIIKKYYEKMVYIDLLAGSGLNTYEGYEDAVLPGSPIIAWTYAYTSFDKLYLVEIDTNSAKALEKRINLVTSSKERFTIYKGCDANIMVHKIMREIEKHKSIHYLAFIDPTGLDDISWTTLQRLLASNIRGDIVLLFHSRQAAREVGKALKGMNTPALDKLLGGRNWLNYIRKHKDKGYEKAITDYLLHKIMCVREEAVLETVRVDLRKKFQYYLIFITCKTRSGNPWLKAVREMKRFVENTPSQTVDIAIGEILGKTKTLTRYLHDKESPPQSLQLQ